MARRRCTQRSTPTRAAERFELVHLLLEHGASAQTCDHDGTGPLFLAMLQDDLARRHSRRPPQVLGLLHQYGARLQ